MSDVYFETLSFELFSDLFMVWLPFPWGDLICRSGCLVALPFWMANRVPHCFTTICRTVSVSGALHVFLLWYNKTNALKLCQDFSSTLAWDKADLQAKNSLEQQPKKQITFKQHNVMEETAVWQSTVEKNSNYLQYMLANYLCISPRKGEGLPYCFWVSLHC